MALGLSSESPGYSIEATGNGSPIKWHGSVVSVLVKVDNVTKLSDGNTRSTAIQAAISDSQRGWNHYLGGLQLFATYMAVGFGNDGDSINQVFFTNLPYGYSWDDNTLAFATTWYSGDKRLESDVLFNSNLTWDSYRGAKHASSHDIERVALHELGHAIGLDHPDEHGQTVTAIMNSVISDVDSLQPDDIAGAQSLYGTPGSLPANDNFANAAVLTLTNNSAQVSATNIGAGKESGEPAHGGDIGGHSVWWKWTAPSQGMMAVNSSGSLFSPTMDVYTGSSVSALTPLTSLSGFGSRPITFLAASGTTYYIAVDGLGGDSGAFTLTASFTPPTLPGFFQLSGSLATDAGGAVYFIASANGSPTPTYRWQRLPSAGGAWADLSDGGAYSGSTTQSLNVGPTTLAMNGDQFRCVASNAAGATTSPAMTLTVNPLVAPTISHQPASVRAKVGQTASFSVTASGTGSLTYQWYFNGQAITGAMASSYTVSVTGPACAGNYSVKVTNTYGSVASSVATLTLLALGADFNGDGQVDLVWSDTQTGERRIWLMNGTGYGSEVSLGTIPGNWVIAGAGDFNADGQVDLLWTDRSTGESRIWLMNGSTYVSAVSLGVVPLEWSIRGTGDFNGDGQTDIVWQDAVTGDGLIWLMNGSVVGSTVAINYLSPAVSISGVGDFNRDGRPDLVLTNTATGARTLWLMSGAAEASTADLGVMPANLHISGVGDYNSDGFSDLLLTNTATNERSIWLMNGATHVGTVSLGVIPPEWTMSGAVSRPIQMPKLDFNRDSQADLLWENASTGEHFIWLMNGTSFNASQFLATLDPAWRIAASGDFNADGGPDLVWENTATGERDVWLLNGTSFGASVSIGTVSTAWRIAAAGDFNGDGQPDLVWENSATGERFVWLMNGTSLASAISLGVLPTQWRIADTADFNGDGQPDIVWENTSTGERYLWLMNGTTFASSVYLGAVSTDWRIAAAADYNGDGQPDLVWENAVTGERYLWLMNGTTFSSSVFLGVVPAEWRIRD